MCLFPGGISSISTSDLPPPDSELIRQALSSLSNVTTNGSVPMRRVASKNDGMMFAYKGSLESNDINALYQFKSQVESYIGTNNNAIYCNEGTGWPTYSVGTKSDTRLDPALSVVTSNNTPTGIINNFCFKCCPSGETCTSITEDECNTAVKDWEPFNPTPVPSPLPSPKPAPGPQKCNDDNDCNPKGTKTGPSSTCCVEDGCCKQCGDTPGVACGLDNPCNKEGIICLRN